jgi:hypothetical protein
VAAPAETEGVSEVEEGAEEERVDGAQAEAAWVAAAQAGAEE